MHHDKTINDPKQKLEILHFQNKTKSGVDIIDEMLGTYREAHIQINQWPLIFFNNIIDIVALAAYLIYFMNNNLYVCVLHKKTNERRLFLRQLGEELCLPAIKKLRSSVWLKRSFDVTKADDDVCLIRGVHDDQVDDTNQSFSTKLVIAISLHVKYYWVKR